MVYVLVENGTVVQRQPYPQPGFIEAPDEVACGMVWDGEAFVAPLPEPVALQAFTYKIDIWRRVDDVEAETLDQLLHTVSAKLRRSFDAAIRIEHDAPEFPELQAGITAALGADRAAAILAPSEG